MSDTSSEPYDPSMEALRDESNFYRWKSRITRHLQFLKLFKIVQGTVPRPVSSPSASSSSDDTAEQVQWDLSSAHAWHFIYSRVAPNIQATISSTCTAPEGWEMLMQRYHRRDTGSLLRSLGAVTNLRLYEGESISEHVDAFRHAWFDLMMRTIDAPPVVEGVPTSLETSLKVMAGSQLCQSQVLIDSLPVDMIVLGWDLQEHHGAELCSWHVNRKLMDLHERREHVKAVEAQKAAEEDCTWCRSRGLESGGHSWKDCRGLRKFNKGKANGRGGRA